MKRDGKIAEVELAMHRILGRKPVELGEQGLLHIDALGRVLLHVLGAG